MVIKVEQGTAGAKITIKHCSEASIESHANLHRFAKGFTYRKPFSRIGTV